MTQTPSHAGTRSITTGDGLSTTTHSIHDLPLATPNQPVERFRVGSAMQRERTVPVPIFPDGSLISLRMTDACSEGRDCPTTRATSSSGRTDGRAPLPVRSFRHEPASSRTCARGQSQLAGTCAVKPPQRAFGRERGLPGRRKPRTPPFRQGRANCPPSRWKSSPCPPRWRRRPARRRAHWRC